MKDSGIQEFGAWITQFDWSQVLETEGTIAKTDTFYEILQKGIDTHFPTREIKMHISDKPWMSSKTKDLIRRRQEVFDPSRPWLWRFTGIKSNAQSYRTKRSSIIIEFKD